MARSAKSKLARWSRADGRWLEPCVLVADVGVPLVMTSGNVSDEPMVTTNDDALAQLCDIADVFLLQRAVPDTDKISMIAAKRYRGADHRLFHRDAGYLEAVAGDPHQADAGSWIEDRDHPHHRP